MGSASAWVVGGALCPDESRDKPAPTAPNESKQIHGRAKTRFARRHATLLQGAQSCEAGRGETSICHGANAGTRAGSVTVIHSCAAFVRKSSCFREIISP